MPEPTDDFAQKLLADIKQNDLTTEASSTAIKTLKTYAEAMKLLEPEPTPVPEPTGVKAFLERHADALIKVGGTLGVVGIIAVIEAKGDIIFRSKATKYL